MCTNIGATGDAVAPAGRAYIGGVSDDPYDIRTKLVVRRPGPATPTSAPTCSRSRPPRRRPIRIR